MEWYGRSVGQGYELRRFGAGGGLGDSPAWDDEPTVVCELVVFVIGVCVEWQSALGRETLFVMRKTILFRLAVYRTSCHSFGATS